MKKVTNQRALGDFDDISYFVVGSSSSTGFLLRSRGPLFTNLALGYPNSKAIEFKISVGACVWFYNRFYQKLAIAVCHTMMFSQMGP